MSRQHGGWTAKLAGSVRRSERSSDQDLAEGVLPQSSPNDGNGLTQKARTLRLCIGGEEFLHGLTERDVPFRCILQERRPVFGIELEGAGEHPVHPLPGRRLPPPATDALPRSPVLSSSPFAFAVPSRWEGRSRREPPTRPSPCSAAPVARDPQVLALATVSSPLVGSSREP